MAKNKNKLDEKFFKLNLPVNNSISNSDSSPNDTLKQGKGPIKVQSDTKNDTPISKSFTPKYQQEGNLSSASYAAKNTEAKLNKPSYNPVSILPKATKNSLGTLNIKNSSERKSASSNSYTFRRTKTVDSLAQFGTKIGRYKILSEKEFNNGGFSRSDNDSYDSYVRNVLGHINASGDKSEADGAKKYLDEIKLDEQGVTSVPLTKFGLMTKSEFSARGGKDYDRYVADKTSSLISQKKAEIEEYEKKINPSFTPRADVSAVKNNYQSKIDSLKSDISNLEAERNATDAYKIDLDNQKYTQWKQNLLASFISNTSASFSPDNPKSVSDYVVGRINKEFKSYPYKTVSNDLSSKYNFDSFVDSDTIAKDINDTENIKFASRFLSENPSILTGSNNTRLNSEVSDFFSGFSKYYSSLQNMISRFDKTQSDLGGQNFYDDRNSRKKALDILSGKTSVNGQDFGLLSKAQFDELYPQTAQNNSNINYLEYLYNGISDNLSEFKEKATTMSYNGMIDKFGDYYYKNLDAAKSLASALSLNKKINNARTRSDVLSEDEWNKLGDNINFSYEDYLADIGTDEASARYQNQLYSKIAAAAGMESPDSELRKDIYAAQIIVDSYDTQNKYLGMDFDNSWASQFKANFALGSLGIQSNKLWYKYLKTGNKDLLSAAKSADEITNRFQMENRTAIEDENKKLKWISKSLAAHLPQELDQLKYGAVPITLGAAAGSLLGHPFIGARLGMAAGSVGEGYVQMTGDAMRSMTNAGLEFDEAKELALNEGFINSIIESGGELVSVAADLAFAGSSFSELLSGKISALGEKGLLKLGVSGKTAKNAVKVANKTAALLAGAASEGGEEVTQGMISKTNERIAKNIAGGNIQRKDFLFLLGQASNLSLYSDEDWKQMFGQDGWEGFKVGLMMSAIHGGSISAVKSLSNLISNNTTSKIGLALYDGNQAPSVIANALMYGDDATLDMVKRYSEIVSDDNLSIDKKSKSAYRYLGEIFKATSEKLKSEFEASRINLTRTQPLSQRLKNAALNSVKALTLHEPTGIDDKDVLSDTAASRIAEGKAFPNDFDSALSNNAAKLKLIDKFNIKNADSLSDSDIYDTIVNASKKVAESDISNSFSRAGVDNYEFLSDRIENISKTSGQMRFLSRSLLSAFNNLKENIGFKKIAGADNILSYDLAIISGNKNYFDQSYLKNFADFWALSAQKTGAWVFENSGMSLEEFSNTLLNYTLGMEKLGEGALKRIADGMKKAISNHASFLARFSSDGFLSSQAQSLKHSAPVALATLDAGRERGALINNNINDFEGGIYYDFRRRNYGDGDYSERTSDYGSDFDAGQSKEYELRRTDRGSEGRVRSSTKRYYQEGQRKSFRDRNGHQITFTEVFPIDENSIAIADYSRLFGYDCQFVKDLFADGISLNGMRKNNTIYLDIHNDSLVQTQGHELLHAIKNKIGSRYSGFVDRIIAFLGNENFEILKARYFDNYFELYSKKSYTDLTPDERDNVESIITEEIAADIVGFVRAGDSESLLNIFGYSIENVSDIIDTVNAILDEGKGVPASDENADVKFSVGYTEDNKPVAVIDDDILKNVPRKDWVDTVKEVIKNKFSTGIPVGGRLIKVNKITRSEYTNSKNAKYLRKYENTIYRDKFKSANHLDDIVLSTTNFINEKLNHTRSDNITEFARGDVLMRVGKNDYKAKVVVGFTSGKSMVLYDIIDIQPTSIKLKKATTYTGDTLNPNRKTVAPSTNNIPQNGGNVKTIIRNNLKNSTGISGNGKNSTRFQVKAPIEEAKNLIAVHNINEDKLYGALELGGFAMPSVAVTKSGDSHEGFGDITVLFGKETIDPKQSGDNKVFGGDAYTPMFPTVEYEADKNVENKLYAKYSDIRTKYGSEAARGLYKYAENTDDVLNSENGEKGIIEAAKNDTALMRTFLYDAGVGEVKTIEKEKTEKISEAKAEQYDYFIEKLGKEAFSELVNREPGVSVFEAKRNWTKKYMPRFDEALKGYFSEKFGWSDEQTSNILNAETTSSKLATARAVLKYINNGKEITVTEPDYAATNELIKKTAQEKGFDAWVDGLLGGIEKTKGIRNGKDPFMPNGNRRSFAQLHNEYTLDNIVKQMRSELQKGQGSLFIGIAQLKGAATKEYGSISEIKADSGRLTANTSAIDDLDNEWYNIADGIVGESGDAIARMNRIEDLSGSVVEAANETKTAEAFKKKLMNDKFYNITEEAADKICSFLNRLREIPVKYFEAKPRRAVGFDEVKAVFVPDNTSPDLITRIKDNGMRVVDYKNGDIADRTAKINDFADSEDVKFQASDVGSRKINYLFTKLTDSIPLMVDDDIVYYATGNEFEVGEKKLSRQVYEYFDSLGGVVHRENFGDVAINDKGVDSSIAHGMGRAKAIVFASVPEVIRKGRQIDFAENWKGRNYDTYVFAAPIQIGTQKAFVGVVVTKNGTDNRYYLHEVSDNDGNIIIIKKDDVSFKSKSETADNSNPLGETSSTDIISQEAQKVKTENTKYQRGRVAKYDTRSVDEKELQGLRLEVERLTKKNELLKAETKLSANGTRRVEASWLKPITDELFSSTGTSLSKRAIAKGLRDAYESIINNPKDFKSYDSIVKPFFDIANDIVENIYTSDAQRFKDFVYSAPKEIDTKDAADVLGEKGSAAVKAAFAAGFRLKRGVGAWDTLPYELIEEFPDFVTAADLELPYQDFMKKMVDFRADLPNILKEKYSYANKDICLSETGMSPQDFKTELVRDMIEYPGGTKGIKQHLTLADKLKDAKLKLKQKDMAHKKDIKFLVKEYKKLDSYLIRLNSQKDKLEKNLTLTQNGQKTISYSALKRISKSFLELADSNLSLSEFMPYVRNLFEAVINRDERSLDDNYITGIAISAARKLLSRSDSTQQFTSGQKEETVTDYANLLISAMDGKDTFKSYADRIANKYEKQLDKLAQKLQKAEIKAALIKEKSENELKDAVRETRIKEKQKADERVDREKVRGEEKLELFNQRKNEEYIRNVLRECKKTVQDEFSHLVGNMLRNGDINAERFVSAINLEIVGSDGRWHVKTFKSFKDYNDAIKNIPSFERKSPKPIIDFSKFKSAIYDSISQTLLDKLNSYAEKMNIDLFLSDGFSLKDNIKNAVNTVSDNLADIASRTVQNKPSVISNLSKNIHALSSVLGTEKNASDVLKLVMNAYKESFSSDALDFEKIQRQKAFDLMVRLEKAVKGKLKQTPSKGFYRQFYTIDDMLKSENPELRSLALRAKALLDANISTKQKSFSPLSAINSKEITRETGRTFNSYKEFISFITDEVTTNENKIFSNALVERAKRINKFYVNASSVNSLSMNQINEILETVPAFIKQLQDQNAFLNSQVREKVDAAAKATVNSLPNLKTDTAAGDFTQKLLRRSWWDWNVIFNRLSAGDKSSPIYKLAYELVRANSIDINSYSMNAYNIIKEFTDDQKYMKSLGNVVYEAEFIDSSDLNNDKKVKIKFTRGLLISLYMHNRRNNFVSDSVDTGMDSSINLSMLNSNQRHIMFGGLVIPDIKRFYDGKISSAFGDYSQGRITLNPDDIKKITEEHLTEKDKKYANACADYFQFAKDQTNNVSKTLEGLEIARVSEYFPIVSDKDFVNPDGFENVFAQSFSDSSSVLNPSTHKLRMEGASNPIMLMDITYVMKNAISSDAKYVSEAIPLSNFNKFISSNIYIKNGMTSLREQIRLKAGDWYIKWLSKWIDGISGKDKPLPKFAQKYMSHFAAAKLTANWKVGLGQRMAYSATEALLGVKPALLAFKHIKGPFNNKSIDDTISRYSPILWSRGRGYSSTDVADASKSPIYRKLGKLADTTTRNDLALMRRIWFACYEWGKLNINEQTEGFRGVSLDSDEFFSLVARKFEDVVMFTQNSFEFSQRAGILWRDNPLLSWLAMFRSDKMKYFSMTQSALDTLYFRINDYKKLKSQGASPQELSAIRKEIGSSFKILARTEKSILKANIKYILFSRILYPIYSPSAKDDEPFRDEKGNLSIIKILEKFAEEIALDRIGQSGAALNFLTDLIDAEDVELIGKALTGDDTAKSALNDSLKSKDVLFIPAADALNSILAAATSVLTSSDLITGGDYYNAFLNLWTPTKTLFEYLTGAPIGILERYIRDGIYYSILPFKGKETAQVAVKQLFNKIYTKNADGDTVLTENTARDLYSSFKSGNLKAFADTYNSIVGGMIFDGVDDPTDVNKKLFSLYASDVNSGVANLDKAYDGKWNRKIRYRDGDYIKTVNVSTVAALESVRKKILKLYDYDILDKIKGASSEIPDGVEIGSAKISHTELNKALFKIGAISEEEATEGASGNDYGKLILDKLLSNDFNAASDIWNAANEFNSDIIVPTDKDKAEVITKKVESEYKNLIKEKLLSGDSSVDGKFCVKIKWKNSDKAYEANATTVNDYFNYKKSLEKSGFIWEEVAGDIIINTDDIDNRLFRIGVADPVSHYGSDWYMSAFYQNNPQALMLYQKNAHNADKFEDWDSVTDDMTSAFRADTQKFMSAGMVDEVNKRISEITVTVYTDGVQKGTKYSFDNYEDFKNAVSKLQNDGYRKGNKKSPMTYKVSTEYNYDSLYAFINEAMAQNADSASIPIDEKKAYLNFVDNTVLNHQPISYETALASPQNATENPQSSNIAVGNTLPTKGSVGEEKPITYKSSSYTPGSNKSGGSKSKFASNGGKKAISSNSASLAPRSLISGKTFDKNNSQNKVSLLNKNDTGSFRNYRSLISKLYGASSRKASSYSDIMKNWFGK